MPNRDPHVSELSEGYQKFNASKVPTEQKPYVLIHRETGQRYTYGTKSLKMTLEMCKEQGMDLDKLYDVETFPGTVYPPK